MKQYYRIEVIPMRILVIDGQSGRLGSQIIEGLRKADISSSHAIIAIGCNSLATSAMLKAGADQGATGENPVLVQCRSADIIVGPLGIVLADALLGEISPQMAVAVGQSSAIRILVPVSQCQTMVVGAAQKSRNQLIDEAVAQVMLLCQPPASPA